MPSTSRVAGSSAQCGAGREVVDEDIGSGDQRGPVRPVMGIVEVERDEFCRRLAHGEVDGWPAMAPS